MRPAHGMDVCSGSDGCCVGGRKGKASLSRLDGAVESVTSCHKLN